MLSSWSYQTCLSHAPSSRLQWLLSLWQTHWEIISLGSMLKKKNPHQHFHFVGQKSTLVLLKCVQKIEKGQDQKILWQCTQHPNSFAKGCHAGCSLERCLKLGTARSLPTPPQANPFNQNWLCHSHHCEVDKVWEIFFSIHVVFFDDIQFLQVLTSFRWFPSSQEDSSLPESKTLLTLYWGISIKPETFLKPRSWAKS